MPSILVYSLFVLGPTLFVAGANEFNDSLKERAKESNALFVPDNLLDFFESNIIYPANEILNTGNEEGEESDEYVGRNLDSSYHEDDIHEKKWRKCKRYQYWCRRPDKNGHGQYFRRMEVDELDIPEEGLEDEEFVEENDVARMIYEHYEENYSTPWFGDTRKRKRRKVPRRKHRKYDDYRFRDKHHKYRHARHKDKYRKDHSSDGSYYSDHIYRSRRGKHEPKHPSDSYDNIPRRYYYGLNDRSSSSYYSRDYDYSSDNYNYSGDGKKKKQIRCDRYHQDYCCYKYQAKCIEHEYAHHETTDHHGRGNAKYEYEEKNDKQRNSYGEDKYETEHTDKDSHYNADISEDFFDYESWADGR
uniref:Uncharacterized protein n=1 Tax=Leptocylindrus danicus TaxID=163516 RepID=A0A7S2PPU3_9STRA|mmetsp:Transcript_6993/g.10443  ORF Transcript_6993/g.10443 Transcript_6993/m.10443 type:complete len:359 (+) Transcript_6993:28-1104(+)